ILAVSGPEKLAVLALAKPIHAEDPRRLRDLAAEVEPVREIIAHVIAAEGKHREWIAAYLADIAEGGGGHFGAHCRGHVNAECPVEGLLDQRHNAIAASAENESRDRYALRIIEIFVHYRTLRDRRRKASVRMRGRLLVGGRPIVALPIDRICWRLAVHALPPHVAVIRQRHVRKDGVRADRLHRVWIRLEIRARGHA